jgi:CheY-specific phosphatase CheX
MGDIASILGRAISEVVERMCFLLPDPEDDDSPGEGWKYISASIGITGQPRLRITVNVDRDLARLMATNALGSQDIEVDEKKVEHFLLETANVICGKFLLVWDGSSGRDLTIPTPDADAVFGPLAATDTVSIDMYYEGKRFNGNIDVFPDARR